MTAKIKNLGKRSISAVFFVIILLACVLWNVYSFTLFFFVVAIWGLWEFYGLVEKHNISPNKWAGLILGAIAYGGNLFFNFQTVSDPLLHIEILIHVLPLIFLIFIFELFRKKDSPFLNIGATYLGIIYVILPIKLFATIPIKNHYIHLSDLHYAWPIPLGIILLIWSNDTFAYLTGSLIGKNKLFERISPGKTWEGTIGGGLLTLLFAYFFNRFLDTALNQTDWIVIASIVVCAGTIGDLIESMLKRSVQVKDSGNIMPGHGGILDRFDSLIFASPFIFTYLFLTH